jgi:bidirectional [NiFe] hydrogenase diaphorase subunit
VGKESGYQNLRSNKAQSSLGYLEDPEDPVLIYTARGFQLPLSRVYGVANSYHLFTLKPSGVNTCIVYTGTAYHVRGSSQMPSKSFSTYNLVNKQ